MNAATDELIELAQWVQSLGDDTRRILGALVGMHYRHPLKSEALLRKWERGQITVAQMGREALRWAEQEGAS